MIQDPRVHMVDVDMVDYSNRIATRQQARREQMKWRTIAFLFVMLMILACLAVGLVTGAVQ